MKACRAMPETQGRTRPKGLAAGAVLHAEEGQQASTGEGGCRVWGLEEGTVGGEDGEAAGGI